MSEGIILTIALAALTVVYGILKIRAQRRNLHLVIRIIDDDDSGLLTSLERMRETGGIKPIENITDDRPSH